MNFINVAHIMQCLCVLSLFSFWCYSEEVDVKSTQYQITVLEEKLGKMKPNMAAIAEYRYVSFFIICDHWSLIKTHE